MLFLSLLFGACTSPPRNFPVGEDFLGFGTGRARSSVVCAVAGKTSNDVLRRSVGISSARAEGRAYLVIARLGGWHFESSSHTRRSSVQIRLPQPEGKTRYLRISSLFLFLFPFTKYSERLGFRRNETVLFGQHIAGTEYCCAHPPSARCRRGQRVCIENTKTLP